MIVTEEEAKTKRCQEGFGPIPNAVFTMSAPMYHGAGHGMAYSPPPFSTAPVNCIGSACMAWRWHNDGLSDYPPDTKGYCGKAGKP